MKKEKVCGVKWHLKACCLAGYGVWYHWGDGAWCVNCLTVRGLHVGTWTAWRNEHQKFRKWYESSMFSSACRHYVLMCSSVVLVSLRKRWSTDEEQHSCCLSRTHNFPRHNTGTAVTGTSACRTSGITRWERLTRWSTLKYDDDERPSGTHGVEWRGVALSGTEWHDGERPFNRRARR